MALDLPSVLIDKLMSIVLPLFGVAAMGNATLEIACIDYSNTVVRCDTGFSIETFYVKQMSP